MRLNLGSVAILMASATLLMGQGVQQQSAQQQGAPQQTTQQQSDPNAQRLDQVLANWEKVMMGMQSLTLECERLTKDKVFNSSDKFKGTAKYLKSATPNQNSRASLEMFKEVNGKQQPDRFEKYVCTGTFLYEFVPGD